MKNDVLARLLYAYMAAYIAVSAFAAPCSATSVMLVRDGFWGYAVTCGTGALAVVIALDVAINDWLPDRYVFHWAKAHRHWLYAITAGAYVTPLFAASAYVVNAAQFIFYIGMALFGLVLGYREAQAKRGFQCAE
jgi:hypothetical protein